ncbi:hypothetical protein ACHWQZ_G017452 [Mnemiopsis leidyi]
MAESEAEHILEFHLKRVDHDGSIVKEIVLQLSSKSSVEDLIEGSRDNLGFSEDDSLSVCHERTNYCLERMMELSKVDNSESLIILRVDTTSYQEVLQATACGSTEQSLDLKTHNSFEGSKNDFDCSDAKFELKGPLNDTFLSEEAVAETITTLLADMSGVDGLEYDIVGEVVDHIESVIKYESFQSEEERRETQQVLFADSKNEFRRDDKPFSSLGDSESNKPSISEPDTSSVKFMDQLRSAENMKANFAIVSKTVDFCVKKCEVKARLNDSLAKKLEQYLSCMDCSKTDIKTCANELDKVLHNSFQSCGHDSEITEGTFLFGGKYRIIATTTSSKSIEFNDLVQKALKILGAVDEMNGSLEYLEKKNPRDSDEDIALKHEKDLGDSGKDLVGDCSQYLRREVLGFSDTGDAIEDLDYCTTTITYEVDSRLDIVDFSHYREMIKDPKHWIVFPRENPTLVSYEEIRRRDKNIALIADIINYADASYMERIRMHSLWEILESNTSESCRASDIWQRLTECLNENDIHLEKLRVFVETEMKRNIPEIDKAFNILKLCERTIDAIGIDGPKSISLSLFKMPSFQPFLIRILKGNESCTEEEKQIVKDRIQQEFLTNLDRIEIQLDPFFQKYLSESKKHSLLNKSIRDITKKTNQPYTDSEKKKQEQVELMTYQDLFVDRPYTESGYLSKTKIIDRLKFRTDVFKGRNSFSVSSESDSASSTSLTYSCNDYDSEEEDRAEDVESQNSPNSDVKIDKPDPFHVLLEVIKEGNLSVKQEVFRRLLEQRYSVPIFFQYSGENEVTNLTNALMFSKVKYLKKFRSIDQDTELPRVVLLSESNETDMSESTDLASHIFNCRFASEGSDMKRFSAMCELTVGFLGGQHQDSECPWMVLHVQGCHLPVLSCLRQFQPDVILVEIDQNITTHKTPEDFAAMTKHIYSWSSSKCKYNYDKKRKLFVGPYNLIVKRITDCLSKLKKNTDFPTTGSKNEIKSLVGDAQHEDFHRAYNYIQFVENTVIMSDIRTIKDRLILQRSFQKQGQLHRSVTFEREKKRRESLMSKIADEENFRATKSILRNQEFLLDLFCNILRNKDTNSRFILANCFEVSIDKVSNLLLEEERNNIIQAYEKFSESQKPNSPNSESASKFKKLYYESKRRYVDKSVGIENIWRELIHSYESAPLQNEFLPGMAAQYLMDGFVLELLDGDTGILCKKWTKALFYALQNKLDELVGREVRVFVLSIMGTQSSGKSTLLNIMFGCRMRVSAGQCTKGVYIQLIKSEFNDRYDYVLILDTEGLRAPEFFGENWSIWKDNRMATLSVLSADVTIITAVNEDDIAIREVVPIILLAHKRSKIAEGNSGLQPTKLFFAYNRVDTTNLSKFLENRQSLHRTLHDAEREMADFGRQDYKSFLTSFNTSDDESKSDIKYFGLLNEGGSPPNDTPNFEFGKKVASFRQYIEDQTLSRTSLTLVEWSDHIQLVYSCLESTNFELSFRSAMEHKAFNEYEKRLDEIKQSVAQAFCYAFSEVEGEIMKSEADPKNAVNLEHYVDMIKNHVQPIVTESSIKVEKILEQNKYDSFREGRKQAFHNFVETLIADKYEKIKITCNGRFKYEIEKQEYQERICSELQKEIEQDSTIKDDDKKQDEIFQRIFSDQLKKCESQYPGVNVREQVESVYANHQLSLTLQHPSQSEEAQPYWEKAKKKLKSGVKALSGLIESVTGIIWNNHSSYGEELLKLESKISEIIYNEKSFDSSVVHKVIHLTNEATRKLDAQGASQWNECTKEFLICRLENVQKTWEDIHSIVAKLKAEEEVLKYNFKNVICKEIFGKDRAIQQISGGLIHALRSGFSEYLSSKVQIAVQDMGWVMDSKILQAHVDLKYLELSKARREIELIDKLSDPKNFYEETVLEKISQFVMMYKVEEWKILVD